MADTSVAEQIDDIIKLHPNWQGELIKNLRAVITSASPEISEEVKWRMKSRPEGLPVWSASGNIVCYVETFKNDSKLVFFYGSKLKDPKKLFNARLNSSVRAIQFNEGDTIDKAGIKALVIEAVEFNRSK
ncbi:DUF1801 domain-containing protein [Candidatus Saccharibacteria bacterium]|nr:DUF1801 domain-containing protein [Candidatus Saccharibacteria bacterium]